MKIHFIGIGGIGVSALAQYYLAKGVEVSGSDLTSSEITELLISKGAKLLIGEHKAENISKDLDLVVYSPAVPEDNIELGQARKFQSSNPELMIKSCPQLLGKLSKDYFTIAVSGSHGKSTTVAMVSLILIKAGLDPTVIFGTKLREFGDSNFRLGKSNYLIIEADEYQASFLNYWPDIIALTNIEEEHLDYYKNLRSLLEAFKKFIGHLSKHGTLIVNKDDKNIQRILGSRFKIQNYSIRQEEAKRLKKILKIPGEHNVSNALAALTVARALNIPEETSFKALSEYHGAWRRFEIKEIREKDNQFTILSDYAHHPTEIKATLIAAREKWLDKKIWVVFQPHQHQRTFYFFEKLVNVFSAAKIEKLILVPIYDVAGREEIEFREKVNALKLVQAIKKEKRDKKGDILYISTIKKTKFFLEKNLQGGEIVIIMGAGNVYELTKMFST